MKRRLILAAFGLVGVIVTVALTQRQHQELGALQQQILTLSARAGELTNSPSATVPTNPPEPVVVASGPSLELLRLRSQVGQLERRKRELAGAAGEQQRLQAQLTNRAAGEATAVRLPPGYIRRAAAQNVGHATPDAALETFMWAIEHRDLSTLMQCIDPKHREDIEKSLKQAGSEDDFFKGADGLVGGLITARETQEDGSVVLKVQMNPLTDDTQNMHFRLVDGRWCLGP
jgi:hypothetical protein